MLMRIGGKDTGGIDETWIEVKNPATGELIDRVPAGTQEDVSFAVDAAEAASGAWAKKTMRERGMILYQAARLVRDQHKELARLLTLEQGKPLKESTDEVRGFANILEFYAGISACQNGEVIRLGLRGLHRIREPLYWNSMQAFLRARTGGDTAGARETASLSASRSVYAELSYPGICRSLSWAGRPARRCWQETPWC